MMTLLLFVATALHDAAWTGDVDKVRELLDHGAAINARTPETGSTPLDYAVVTNHIAVVELLLHRGAKINSALTIAASRGYSEIAKLLIDANAPVTSAPLEAAAQKGHTEVVKLLLDHHADPLPALQSAVLRGDTAMVKLLAGHGVAAGMLHDAALRGYTEIAAILLTEGAQVDARDNDGATPLHTASLKGYTDLVKLLLDHGADINARETESGSTPLYAAASLGRAEVVRLLLERGADSAIPNKTGRTAAEAAIQNGFPEIAKGIKNPWN